MNNLYENCIKCSDPFYNWKDSEFKKELENKFQEYSKSYKVVFVDVSGGISAGAEMVLYDKEMEIPKVMQEYDRKWVRFKGEWIRQGLLGICDKCNEYDELVCLCREGNLCHKCSIETWGDD